MAILEVEHIKKKFGKTDVLKDISFSLEQGEVLSIIGSSGSGKTTLLRCLNFLEMPDNGIIRVNNEILLDTDKPETLKESEVRKKRLHFGLVFQSFNLFPQYTALQNVMLARELLAKERPDYKANKKNILDEIRVQGEDLLRQMGLGDRMNNYPHQLSGGMRQRVCIASALVTPKELLIADEPCTALDVTIQDQIHHLLRVLVEEKKRSLIMITHSLGVARELVDRIYIMYGGNIVETCRTEDLFKSPSHPYTQGLLSCVPRLSGGGLSAGIYGYVPDYVNPPEGCRFAPRCPYATEICKKKRPPVVEIESEHKVACFRYADGKTEKEGAE